MKKKLLFAAGLLCMTISFHSCELKDCEVCRQVTRENASGDILNESAEAEYCDAELIAIKATAAVPAPGTGNATTKWECR